MKTQSSKTRKGTVLVAVLVCMGLATSVLLGAVHTSLQMRRAMRQELQMEQTKWLMDMGIRKAIYSLSKKADYDGENLVITPALGKYTDSAVEITVDRDNSTADRIVLTITARVKGPGQNQTSTTQRSTQIVVNPADNTTKNP